MRTTNKSIARVAATLCLAVSAASGQPTINSISLRGQMQTPYDGINNGVNYGRHFYSIAASPGSINAFNGLGQTFSISLGALVYFDSPVVSGTGPFSYQWYLNGSSLAGETSSTLGFPGRELAAGDYAVFVTDSQGQSAVSQNVTIAIDPTFTKIMTGPVVTSYDQRTSSTGCAWGDFDNDGYLDLFTCGGLDGVAGRSQLFRNNRDGTFSQINSGPLVNTPIFGNAVCLGDYDNDGNLDVLITTDGVNLLYHNNGGPDYTFSQIVSGSLVTDYARTGGAAWVDYDQDGFLDLFVATFDPNTNASCFLYRNNGDGTFTSVSNIPLVTDRASSVGCAWADYDNDGNIDVFVGGGRGQGAPNAPNRLYHNDGHGSFTRVSDGSIAHDQGLYGSAAWGDYDNDGYPDLFVTGYSTPLLYHNNRDGTFTSVTGPIISGSPTGWFTLGNKTTSCAWGDYDNDGFLDLFTSDEESIPSGLVLTANCIYHNNGDGTFTQLSSGSEVTEAADGFGGSWVDYDNDGFLDLFAPRGDGRGHYLYHNNLPATGNSNNWLTVKLVGTVSNRSAIGAKVRAKAFYRGASQWQLRQITGGGGSFWGGGGDLLAHFGLGDATNVETLHIEWPSGTVQEFHNVAPRQIVTYTEPPRMWASTVGGVPQLSIKGGRFMQYEIQGSTDLASWAPVGTLTITNIDGTAQITDPGPSDPARRFYRAVSR